MIRYLTLISLKKRVIIGKRYELRKIHILHPDLKDLSVACLGLKLPPKSVCVRFPSCDLILFV